MPWHGMINLFHTFNYLGTEIRPINYFPPRPSCLKVGKSLRGWGNRETHLCRKFAMSCAMSYAENLLINEGIKRESKMSTLEIWNLKSEMHLSLKQRGRKQLMTCLNLSPAFWPSEPTIVQSNCETSMHVSSHQRSPQIVLMTYSFRS